jgi:hypothetical protein
LTITLPSARLLNVQVTVSPASTSIVACEPDVLEPLSGSLQTIPVRSQPALAFSLSC